MASRLDSPAPDKHVTLVKRGRGREGEPTEWTGWVSSAECEIEGSPDLMMHDDWDERPRGFGSHWPPSRQEKPLTSVLSARTANRHR
jgi:hypothetical protein